MYEKQLFEYEISFPITEICVINFSRKDFVYNVLPEADLVGRNVS